MLVACTPGPEPEPAPTKTALFSSDEEAFAAAEETYRAYTDALNQVDTGDPDTFDTVIDWTIGEASAALRESLSELRAKSVVLVGSTTIQQATPLSVDPDTGEISMHICADVSKTDVLDSTGASL